MPRLISENDKRAKRNATARATRVNVLVRCRDIPAYEAARLVDLLDATKMLAHTARLLRATGDCFLAIDVERQAVDALNVALPSFTHDISRSAVCAIIVGYTRLKRI